MKLIKNVVGEYHLIADKCPDFVSISEPVTNGFVIASLSHKETDFLKLSQKNCDSIALGYDLDELFQREIDELMFTGNLEDPSEYRSGMYKGAKILLEILADRKFTEEDMIKFSEYCLNNNDCFSDLNDNLSKFQSLQQNEWEVEIITEPLQGEINGCNWVVGGSKRPKFDSEGNIILKRL